MAGNQDFQNLDANKKQIQLAMLPYLTSSYLSTLYQGNEPKQKKAELLTGNELRNLIHNEPDKSQLVNPLFIEEIFTQGKDANGNFNAAKAEENILKSMSQQELQRLIAFAVRMKAGAEKALSLTHTTEDISSKL